MRRLAPGLGMALAPVALACLLAFTASPAQGAFPGQNGKIAFSSDREGNGEIYVMNPDGSGQTNLTRDPAADDYPAWSPDGRRIAFASQRDAGTTYEIYVMNGDGSGAAIRLTTNAADDLSPTWSPDGTRIAFETARDGNSEIYVMNADGTGTATNVTNAPSGNDQSPAWSPDGERMAFTSNRDGNAEVWIMNADGSGQTRLTQNINPRFDGQPDWSPNGTTIAYTCDCDATIDDFDVVLMDTDPVSITETRITDPNAPALAPAWSPDGTRIAYTSGISNFDEIFAMNANGSGQGNLTRGPASGLWTPLSDWQRIIPTRPPPPGAAQPAPELLLPVVSALPAPVLGRRVNVEPVRGSVFVSLPASQGARASRSVPGLKGRRFVPLRDARQIPVGSFLDARRGTVRLVSQRSTGSTQSGEFSAGVFQVLQSRRARARGLTELRLKGSSFTRCGSRKGARSSSSRLSRRTVRRLRASARGRFRTRGRYSAATVRGTVWTTVDRCNGTLTSVSRGRVAVRDFRRKKTILLRAGKRYLARARR